MLATVVKHLVNVTTLKTLKLARNKLVKLPQGFERLMSLTDFDLSFNQIQVLPDGVWELSNLLTLNLGTNKLLDVPKSVENLQQLRLLDLSDNNIKVLPMELGKLRNLETPIFRGNPLQGIPANLLRGGDKSIFACWRAMCDSLRSKKFDISATGMVDLPAQIGTMTWLTELDLSNNQLVQLTPLVGSLVNVRIIDLSHNRLGMLPSEIGKLTELRSLNVQGNNIRQLPLELGFCVHMREIKVDETMIVLPSKLVMSLEVRAIMIYLRRLFEASNTGKLGLTGMGLPNVPKEVWGMTELRQLHVDKNKVTELERDLVYFDDLEDFSANLNYIQDLSFLCGDSGKAPWNKQRLHHLTHFRIRGNKIQAIPPEITRLKALRVFQIDNNRLETVPEELGYMKNLELLTLSRNEIVALPWSFSALVELNSFDCSHNKIKVLPFGLGKLPDLIKFIFSSNPVREPPVEITKQVCAAAVHYRATPFEVPGHF